MELVVLVVEDDPDAALLARTLIQVAIPHATVTTCTGLDLALDLLVTSPVDVVVLDLGLPDAPGTDPMDVLRRVLAVPRPPAVVVLTSADDELAAEALRAGAQDFVPKADFSVPRVLGRAVAFAHLRHQRAGQLLDERGRLLKVNAHLQHFAASMAHDVKGPVSTALVALETARREEVAGRPELQAQMLDSSTEVLTRLVDQVDRLLEDVQGSLAGQVESLDVGRELDEVLAGLVDGGRLDLDRAISVDLPARQGALRQILQNALDNALVHNPDGDVRVRVSTYTAAQYLCLAIEDDGVGIAEEVLGRVVEPGFRDSPAPGHGLGLTTVELSAQSMGGSAVIDRSPELGGVRIRVALPSPSAAVVAGDLDAAGLDAAELGLSPLSDRTRQ